MEELIKFSNVKKAYNVGEKSFNALDGVNFVVGKGEFVVILGPSGAGKSTLLNLLGGMDKPSSRRNYSRRKKYCKIYRRRIN